jgi:radical SAM superfamily enzyme with C-terminal helix-hairpin-helix motif
MTRTLLTLLLFLLVSNALSQQEQAGFVSASSLNLTITNYYFAKPNEMTIVVSVMGHVQRPGRYEIAKSIDLINLLALAGGANSVGTLGDVTVTRFIEQKGGYIKRTELHLDLDALATVASADLVVSPGDIVSVGRSTWTTVRDIFISTASAAVIVTAISQVILVTRK